MKKAKEAIERVRKSRHSKLPDLADAVADALELMISDAEPEPEQNPTVVPASFNSEGGD